MLFVALRCHRVLSLVTPHPLSIDYPQFSTDCSPGNRTTCKANFVHQAGAYQRDAPYTDTPFYSPSLAKFCSGNSCIFASWGTQAHVETPFTSSIMNINKYTNCGSGVIEHVQMCITSPTPTTRWVTSTLREIRIIPISTSVSEFGEPCISLSSSLGDGANVVLCHFARLGRSADECPTNGDRARCQRR